MLLNFRELARGRVNFHASDPWKRGLKVVANGMRGVHTSKGGRGSSKIKSRFVRCREGRQHGEGLESGDSRHADGLKLRDGSHGELGHGIVESASQRRESGAVTRYSSST